MLFLCKELIKKNISATLLYGAKTARQLVRMDPFHALGIEVRTATEDGSSGHKGLVTELLAWYVNEPECVLYACGPRPMLRAAKTVAEAAGVESHFSLEEYMGCGFGVCLGCSVPSARKSGAYLLTCKDGPVFDPREVII
jgi:dihydroorotate dehydrogenase electron transfer subunit